MASGPTSRVESLPLREVWPREAEDFSQWLVSNIDFLNEHLPFEIDPESLKAEQSAGDFYVDVVGDATTPAGEQFKVVIENQLEPTDHKHLGQILTYTAAFDAKAAIWISAQARPEHAKAVQWLNDESGIEAWLFDVEVIRIKDSPPAPLLRRIIGPSLLSAKARQEKRTTEAHKVQKAAFWETVLPIVQSSCHEYGLYAGREPSGNPYQSQRADGPAVSYWQVWVTAHGSWACLRILGESKEESAHYFGLLHEAREEIESAFGGELRWEPLPTSTSSVVRWDNPVAGGYMDEPDSWNAAGESLGAAARGLAGALRSRVTALPQYETDSADDGEGQHGANPELGS